MILLVQYRFIVNKPRSRRSRNTVKVAVESRCCTRRVRLRQRIDSDNRRSCWWTNWIITMSSNCCLFYSDKEKSSNFLKAFEKFDQLTVNKNRMSLYDIVAHAILACIVSDVMQFDLVNVQGTIFKQLWRQINMSLWKHMNKKALNFLNNLWFTLISRNHFRFTLFSQNYHKLIPLKHHRFTLICLNHLRFKLISLNQLWFALIFLNHLRFTLIIWISSMIIIPDLHQSPCIISTWIVTISHMIII